MIDALIIISVTAFPFAMSWVLYALCNRFRP